MESEVPNEYYSERQVARDWALILSFLSQGQSIDDRITKAYQENDAEVANNQKGRQDPLAIRKLLKYALLNLYDSIITVKHFKSLNDELVNETTLRLIRLKETVKKDNIRSDPNNSLQNSLISGNETFINPRNSILKAQVEGRPPQIADQTINSHRQRLQQILSGVKASYKQFFEHSLGDMEVSALTRVENMLQTGKITSGRSYFLMGLFNGVGGIILIIIFFLLSLNLVDLNYESTRIDSMDYIFPMFRGVALLILYLWGMSWNVYGFSESRISFRKILNYGDHYSSHFQIIKRAGFFTLVLGFMLMLYIIGSSMNKYNDQYHRWPVEYTPLAVWILYLSYIFFPNRDVFNPKGRNYFYRLLKTVLMSPFTRSMSFIVAYATDQAVSFIVPLKDAAYTICFYTSNLTVGQIKNCFNSNAIWGIVVGYIVAVIPLFYRMAQCYRQTQMEGKPFYRHLQMYNFIKYSASYVTATISFAVSFNSAILPVYIVSSVVSTLYSFYWDLKNDWGFLQQKSNHLLLRNNLSYGKSGVYYAAIISNLIMRCAWTLTISPSVVKIIPKSTFLPFVLGFIEIVRRCMWNFFRVEKEHIANCKGMAINKFAVSDYIKEMNSPDPSVPSILVKSRVVLNDQQEDAFLGVYPNISYLEYLKEQRTNPEEQAQMLQLNKQLFQTSRQNEDKYTSSIEQFRNQEIKKIKSFAECV